MLNEIEMRGPIEWRVIHLPTRMEVMRVWAVNDHAAKRAAGCYDWSVHTVLEGRNLPRTFNH